MAADGRGPPSPHGWPSSPVKGWHSSPADRIGFTPYPYLATRAPPVVILFPVIGCVLLVLAGLMLDAHRRTWLAASQQISAPARQLRADRAQYLRRMQASGSLAAVGALLIIQPMIPPVPLAVIAYTLALVLGCGYILLLGTVDWFATWLRVRKSREQKVGLRTQLEAEIEAARQRHSNSDEPH